MPDHMKQVTKKWGAAQSWPLYLMLLPAVALTLVFNYVPMYGVVIAFQDYNLGKGVWNSSFIGLSWFHKLFTTPDIGDLLYNTLFISVGKILIVQVVALVFSLLLNEMRHRNFKRMVQTMVYIPYFLSWVVIGGVMTDLLSSSGIVNHLIGWFGIKPTFFLGSNIWFRWVIILTDVWKSYGWSAIIYLAALTAVDPSLYDACSIDGGGKRQQIFHITLPGISSTVVLLAVLSLGGVLNAGFEQVLVMYNPAVYRTADIIDTYVYRMGLEQMQYSFATAVGLLKSAVGFFLITLSYWLSYRFADYRII